MITENSLLADWIKHYVSYDPEAGKFYWTDNFAYAPNRGKEAGTANEGGYISLSIKRKSFWAHRVAWFLTYGDWPKNQIDHINGNPSDNRISNLRDVTPSDNRKNSKLQKNSRTGIPGVTIRKNNTFLAMIRSKNERIYLGIFEDFFEACCVRKRAELKYNFHENHGRAA